VPETLGYPTAYKIGFSVVAILILSVAIFAETSAVLVDV
jgi:hypothetical protein